MYFPTFQLFTCRHCQQTLEKVPSLKPMDLSHVPMFLKHFVQPFSEDIFRYSNMAIQTWLAGKPTLNGAYTWKIIQVL